MANARHTLCPQCGQDMSYVITELLDFILIAQRVNIY